MATTYVVSDGTLTLNLEEAEEGGFNVTCPDDPQLITQAESLREAFAMAYDAARGLAEIRQMMADRAQLGGGSSPVGGSRPGEPGALPAEVAVPTIAPAAPSRPARRRLTLPRGRDRET